MDELTVLKRKVTSSFKLSGYSNNSDVSLFLAEQLLPLDEDLRKEWLDKIIVCIQNQSLKNNKLEKEHIELAIKECERTGLDENETVFSVISAFEVPQVAYKRDKKRFLICNEPRNVLSNAQQKAKYLLERYNSLWQKTSRHELFAPKIGEVETTRRKKLYLIENLIASSWMDHIYVLGYLSQIIEGKLYIEDPTGSLPLDLSKVEIHDGLFCEGCFVLIEGKYDDGIIKVKHLRMPPPESGESSRAYFGSINTWGGPGYSLLKESQRLSEIEHANTNATIVFLSDCWLDDDIVVRKLRLLFTGYDEFPPVAIILMGPFAKSVENPYEMKGLFRLLGEIIAGTENIKNSTQVVLVPSLDDPTAPSILPRAPIPNALASELLKCAPKTILATNPCRLQYCTQQIVVCRADLLTKMCRNTIHFPTTGSLPDHFAKTLICQGTLAPMLNIIIPTYWDYDDSLALYPLPDLIVVGDASEGFQTTQSGCTVVNTGSFPKSKFVFKVYVPHSRTIEDSEIPEMEFDDTTIN